MKQVQTKEHGQATPLTQEKGQGDVKTLTLRKQELGLYTDHNNLESAQKGQNHDNMDEAMGHHESDTLGAQKDKCCLTSLLCGTRRG